MKANAYDIVGKARQVLGGVLSANQYKDYVLALFFLKSATEYYRQNVYSQPGNNKPFYRLLVPERSSFDYLFREIDSPELDRLINIALLELEQANSFESGEIEISKAIDFENNILGEANKRRNRLCELIFFFQNMTFADDSGKIMDIGLLYNELLYAFAEEAGKKIDNVFTPKEIVALVAKLTDDKENASLCDPASSNGVLLVEAGKRLKSKGSSIYGQEVNGNLYALAKMSLMLNGFKNATLLWGDSLGSPKLTDENGLKQFDIVVSVPPFANKWAADEASRDPYGRFVYGIPSKSMVTWAYISHILASLRTDGQAIVVVPVGVLFRDSESKIRCQIIERNLLEAVIVLPQNLFYGTAIGTAILVFRRGRKMTKTVFVDARKMYVSGKGINKLSDGQVEQILNIYKGFCSQSEISEKDSTSACIATQDEIRNNKYDLQIIKYIKEKIDRKEIDIEKALEEIRRLESKWLDINREIAFEIKLLNDITKEK